MKTKIIALLSTLTIFTACEREDIYDFMKTNTHPLLPEIKTTLSPIAQFHNDAYTVSITSRKGAIIEYTINGADPVPGAGTVYTGPFDVTTGGSHQIKAIGYTGIDTELVISEVSTSVISLGDGNAIPYEIATAAQLNNIRAPYLVNTFLQTADIDLSAYSSGEGWMPIGNDTQTFDGSFDGSGYKITGLKINRLSEDYIGLFGKIAGATLTNIYLEGVIVAGGYNVGGIVGHASNTATITNCRTTGSISGNGMFGGLVGNLFESGINGSYSTCIVTGGGNAGGLVGFMYDSTVSQSYATGNVSATGMGAGGLTSETGGAAGSITESYSTGKVTGVDNTGGLVGRVSLSTINRCYATGEVFATGTPTGGLAGSIENGGTVSQSFAKGKVTGDENTGGLAGYVFDSSINNCYATGEVNATWVAGGGLVGYLGDSGTAVFITNSYSTGKVTGPTVGGLLGNTGGTSAANTSVWDEITSTQSTSAGGVGVSGVVTSAMKTQSTFTALVWDFATIWTIQEGVSYPYFQWQGAANIPN